MMNRSHLYLPGDNEKHFDGLEKLNADIITFDLEDAVTSENKGKARQAINKYLSQKKISKNYYVRVNSLETGLTKKDIEAVYSKNLTGITVPKVETKGDIKKILPMVKSKELAVIIESALGIENIFEILKSSNKIKFAYFGSFDYTKDIGISLTNDEKELLFVKSRFVNACIATNVIPIAGPIQNYKDKKAFTQKTKNEKSLGFKGKLLIHPCQIDDTNKIYKVTLSEYEISKAIVQSYENNKDGKGAISVEGILVDKPVYEKAKQTVYDFEAEKNK